MGRKVGGSFKKGGYICTPMSDSCENLSQREVAQRSGVSQMSISRLERAALELMRQQMEKD